MRQPLKAGQRLKVIRDHQWTRQGETLEVVVDEGKHGITVKGEGGGSTIYHWALDRGDIVPQRKAS